MNCPRIVLVCVVLTLLVMAGPTPRPQARVMPAAPSTAEWTLLFYMDLDNDLEASQLEDLQEMLAVGSSKQVNIVVLADRHPKGDGRKYSNEPIGNVKNWTSAKLFVVEHNNLRELADWGEVDMGDPSTLKRFLEVEKQFPAKRYGVIFGDHGTGWPGACSDETNNDNMLTTQEIGSALAEAATANGKFELIGFDACLMANLEVAKAIAPAGKFMVASEELEPGSGWSYTALLGVLAKNPQMTGSDLGRVIVDTFEDSFLKSPDQDMRDQGIGITLSVIALDQLGPLEKAVSDFGVYNQTALIKPGSDSWKKIARARSTAEEYGRAGEGAAGDSMFDLNHLIQNLQKAPPDSDVASAGGVVAAALKNAVVYSKHGRGRPNASGLSIFFPSVKEDLTAQQWRSAYPQMNFSRSAKWFPFLMTFTGAEAADTVAPEVADVATNDAEVDADDVASITAHVKADDIDEASFVLAQVQDGEETILGSLPTEPAANGLLKESWDGDWFTIGDDKKEFIRPITSFEEINDEQDVYWVVVPAEVRFKGTNEWFDVSLYFYTDFNGIQVKGEFVYAFEQTKSGPRQIELEAGDEMRPVYYSIDAEGEEHYSASEDPDDIFLIKNTDAIVVGRGKVDPGDYKIGFVVTDLAGNTTEKFTSVKID